MKNLFMTLVTLGSISAFADCNVMIRKGHHLDKKELKKASRHLETKGYLITEFSKEGIEIISVNSIGNRNAFGELTEGGFVGSRLTYYKNGKMMKSKQINAESDIWEAAAEILPYCEHAPLD